MDEPEDEKLHPDDLARGIVHRKRVPAPEDPVSSEIEGSSQMQPDGVMWPSDGFEADQYSPAGEVTAFANFFQAIQRRWRRRH